MEFAIFSLRSHNRYHIRHPPYCCDVTMSDTRILDSPNTRFRIYHSSVPFCPILFAGCSEAEFFSATPMDVCIAAYECGRFTIWKFSSLIDHHRFYTLHKGSTTVDVGENAARVTRNLCLWYRVLRSIIPNMCCSLCATDKSSTTPTLASHW